MFIKKDINDGAARCRSTANSYLIDVRTHEEYAAGHIDKSINIPLGEISAVKEKIADKNAPLFVYCLSGARSSQAARILNRLGYTNVNDIGGINGYRGKIVS